MYKYMICFPRRGCTIETPPDMCFLKFSLLVSCCVSVQIFTATVKVVHNVHYNITACWHGRHGTSKLVWVHGGSEIDYIVICLATCFIENEAISGLSHITTDIWACALYLWGRSEKDSTALTNRITDLWCDPTTEESDFQWSQPFSGRLVWKLHSL